MDEFLRFLPVFEYVGGLFLGGLAVAVGLTLWIMSRLNDQDARRIELKEVLLKEIRDSRHDLRGQIDTSHQSLSERIFDVNSRLIRVETVLNGAIHPKG